MNNTSFASLLGMILLLATTCIFHEAKAKLHAGSAAPEFSLPDENGKIYSLSDFLTKKKNIALSFYPKDNSPHCTKEMCSLRDGYQRLSDKNIIVIGISYDSAKTHSFFKQKHRLPFTLLTDKDKKVTKLYNATGSWYTFGFIPQRITFLIDQKGKIIKIIDNVDINDHAQQIIDAFSHS